jgi:tricorn protease
MIKLGKIQLLIYMLTIVTFSATATTGYYRYPALHNDTLVFTAEGDLWVQQLNNSKASRLTTNTAEETQAAISKDGTMVAFVANYEGANEIYYLPITGGIAKRATYENSNVKLHGWTPAGDLLYSTTTHTGPLGNWTLKLVTPNSLITKEIPLADAVEGMIDPDGHYIYFSQFGLQVSNDNARYYKGGAKGELWRFDLEDTDEAQQLTKDHEGSVREPMVDKNHIYFISNDSGNDNLWQMNLNGRKKKQLTHFTDYPIRSAKLDNNRIVFQHGADIKIYSLATQQTNIVTIGLTSDSPHMRDKWETTPLKYLNSVSYSGEHKKVVLTARGRVAIANTDKSRLIEIATPATTRVRKALLSHDGKWVYAISDTSGEMEIWQYAADGSSASKQLTDGNAISLWQLKLSPDGKWLTYDDFNGDLWLLNTDTTEKKRIQSEHAGMSPRADIVWSADSQLLAIAYNNMDDNRTRIALYDLTTDKLVTLTSDKYESYSPAFSSDGQWLYFLSDREFTPTTTSPWGDRNMGTSFDRKTQIFAYALFNDSKFPFQPANELINDDDSLDSKNAETGEENSSETPTEAKDIEPNPRPAVEWADIQKRLWQVPVKAGNYRSLQINNKYLYVIDKVTEPGSQPSLKSITQSPTPKTTTFVSGIATYSLSNDGKNMYVLKSSKDNSQQYIVPASSKFPSDTKGMQVNAGSWQLKISPQQEWSMLFNDAWLMHRDFFFDPQLRQVDWIKMKDKYQVLLKRVSDRYELNDVLGQMTGELNALHSQVYGGDVPIDPNRPKAASLGATLAQTAQGVTIQHIYHYDTELPAKASPLLKPGSNARDGDVITAINGRTVTRMDEVNNALLNQAGKQVLLTLQRNDESVKTVVYPVSARQGNRLRYYDWVSQNREHVEQESSKIGYLHLYAMGQNDVSDFAREFYAAYDKEGLIIDVRRNRGGNVDSWFIEKLLRKAWMFWNNAHNGEFANMQQTFRGHLVVLADQYTYSDGETFTAGIKALELGPVIGKQTAGAGVWLRGLNSLADRGMARVAELPVYAMDGRWIVEGRGVSPTIEVDNLPYATFMGKDAQLETAIEYLQKKIKKSPVKPLKSKPFPPVNEMADDITR